MKENAVQSSRTVCINAPIKILSILVRIHKHGISTSSLHTHLQKESLVWIYHIVIVFVSFSHYEKNKTARYRHVNTPVHSSLNTPTPPSHNPGHGFLHPATTSIWPHSQNRALSTPPTSLSAIISQGFPSAPPLLYPNVPNIPFPNPSSVHDPHPHKFRPHPCPPNHFCTHPPCILDTSDHRTFFVPPLTLLSNIRKREGYSKEHTPPTPHITTPYCIISTTPTPHDSNSGEGNPCKHQALPPPSSAHPTPTQDPLRDH
eukprot:573654-Hanusia_phi.AAC.3